MGKRGITGGTVRQIGCEKIKLSETINFMAGVCHLLGTSGIVLARGTERGTADAGEDDEGRVACGQRALHALLLACAGENAVQTFHAQTRQSEAARPQERGALAGCVIALDAGHGGYDGGAVGRVSGTPEKGLNLDVARRLAAILEEQGAQIVMTRTDDYALCDEHPPIRKKLQDMQRRAAIIEQSGAQMVLSIHMNEYAGRSQSGPQVFYREGCPAGRLLAGAIQEAMNETLAPKKKRSALGGDYYILTLGRPSVLVECGFLSNAGEEALLLTADYRQRVAQAIARGIWAWANLPEEKPEALPAVERGGEAEAET